VIKLFPYKKHFSHDVTFTHSWIPGIRLNINKLFQGKMLGIIYQLIDNWNTANKLIAFAWA